MAKKKSANTKKGSPGGAAVAARRAERRELEARGIAVNIDPRDEEILLRYRPDCFTMLLKGRAAEKSAILWLEELIRTAQGENAPERRPDYIRGSSEGAPGQNVSQTMIDASAILIVVTEAMPPAQARMLFELLKPDEALLTRWHSVVERCVGEKNPQAQGAAVRAACGQLVWVRQNVEKLARQRVERRIAA